MQLARKFELEEAVIELHNIARRIEKTTKEIQAARIIREMADELSNKAKRAN